MKKQAEARRITEIEDKDLTEEEKDPIYLRDKGVYVQIIYNHIQIVSMATLKNYMYQDISTQIFSLKVILKL